MVDVAGMPAGFLTTPRAAGFIFEVADAAGPGGAATAWRPAPAPAVCVRRGAGAGGSDRVLLAFPSVRNQWLRVTVKAGHVTGLPDPDVFILGNLVGATGHAALPLRVGAVDLAAGRRHSSAGPVPVASAH